MIIANIQPTCRSKLDILYLNMLKIRLTLLLRQGKLSCYVACIASNGLHLAKQVDIDNSRHLYKKIP